ncbi:MAG: glycosyltransferase family 39 protein [Bacteroidetes bacterium]|nr:glycosyltransferase family 39 protein [Bacteroidota bacterium]
MRKSSTFILYLGIPLMLTALNLFLIQKADFLFNWDERFHALVAKNLLKDPTIPRLLPQGFEELAQSETAWYQSAVWLHKPPLFTYIEALFLKLFGLGLFQFRMASALSVSLLYLCFLRISILCKASPFNAAFISLGICLNPFLLKLMMGWKGMDHNDLAFITYISLGVLAALSYHNKPHFVKLLLFSMAIAAAILTKWLAGLLPLLFWIGLRPSLSWKNIKPTLISLLLITLMVSPWHLYIHQRFPQKAMQALNYNGRHFFEALEGHSHQWYYHFAQWGEHYFLSLLLLFCLIVLRFRAKTAIPENTASLRSAYLSIGFVFLFFSIAQTKLQAFTFILLPIFLVVLASWISSQKKSHYLSLGFIVLAIAQMAYMPFINFSERFPSQHGRAEFFMALDKKYSEPILILGAKDLHQIEGMFYSKHVILDPALARAYKMQTSRLNLEVYQLKYDDSGQMSGLMKLGSNADLQ